VSGRRWLPEAVIVVGLVAAGAVVHRLGPMLRTPYWIDEAWVALASKASPAELPWLSSASPLGWTALVSLVPPSGQAQRVVVWLFLLATVPLAYALGRRTGLGRPTAALVAVVVLLLPAQLYRHDLKQYTADAAVALTLLALLAWAEETRSTRRTAVLGAAAVAGMLVSHPAALVGGAALLGLVATARSHWRPALAVAAASATGMLAVYLFQDRPRNNAALSSYWVDYFPSLTRVPGYLPPRLVALEPALGVPWWVAVGLAGAGVATVARRHRPATAIALGAIPFAAAVAGVLRLYPLLDQRTSHFLLVLIAAAAAIGVVGLAAALTRALPRTWPRTGLSHVAAAAAIAAFAVANAGLVLRPPPPGVPAEDVRAQVDRVAAERSADDVILVNFSGQYGFAYYWHGDRPLLLRGGSQATGWRVDYPAASRIVVAEGRDPESVALALAKARGVAGSGRIWLVRSHVNADEAQAWLRALEEYRVTLLPVGPEPLAVVTVEPAGAGTAPG
jgi:hypothetical protein